MHLRVMNKSFSVKLIAVIALTLVAGALITAVFFFYYADKSLGDSYTHRLVSLSNFKYEVLKKSLYIYLIFGALIAVSLIAFGIYYSHKVAGPLFRIRLFAKDMRKGNFGVPVKFRSGDVIHPVAEAANGFSKRYEAIYSGLDRAAGEMLEAAVEMKKAIDEADRGGTESAVSKISSGSKELDRMLSDLKL